MKIVELITFLSSGGAERFTVDLSNELAKDNEVYLVTLLNDTIDSSHRNFYKSDICDNVHYINIGLPNGLKISSQWKVYRVLKKINPDVIQIHLPPSLNYAAFAIGLLAFTKTIVFSVHSDLRNGHNGGLLWLYCNTLGRMGRFRLSCLSNKNYSDFISYYKHTPIRCITNGRAPIVATSKFNAVKEELNNLKTDIDSILLMHIARCHPVKNQNLLIDAVNELISKGYNLDLVLIGSGYDSTEGKKLVEKSNKQIHFLGTRKNISDYILNADLFCLSSDYEGMPITLLEASLAGVPAVSTPVCGAVDLICDGINGFLSKSHNLEDYTEALIKAITNYETIKTNAIRMKDNSPYTISECASKYLDYFKK